MKPLLIIIVWMALPNRFGLCLLKPWNNAVPTIIFCYFPFSFLFFSFLLFIYFYVGVCRDTKLTMLYNKIY